MLQIGDAASRQARETLALLRLRARHRRIRHRIGATAG
jgi:hypothetical protein